jgi:hypothetical protein
LIFKELVVSGVCRVQQRSGIMVRYSNLVNRLDFLAFFAWLPVLPAALR